MNWTKERRARQARWCKESWKDKEIRRKRLENRSANPKWQASRSRVGRIAANALHEKHRAVYLAGQIKHSRTMKKMFQNPAFKKKHRAAVRKAICGNAAYSAKLSKVHKELFKAGGSNTKFIRTSPVRISRFEREFITHLRSRKLKCRAQMPIPNSLYTVDVYLPIWNLVVEIDGHPFHTWKKGRAHRRKRDRAIRNAGYSVLHLGIKSIRKGVEHCYRRVFAFSDKAQKKAA